MRKNSKDGPAQYSAEENLQRISRSGILEDFARKNDSQWDHSKWLELCDLIIKKGYVPVDFDKVGLMLEDIKSDI
ncbi:MAG TPA: hypothetical protein DET40_24365 [Lentisphaeria bacterium]|nr:MAG: hypothetical protein A2X45_00120 [Lentisphaerae bacterium GWF2_50_93]HCE46694.1 hypothetical protein [Lentisphaeria bacterium]